MTQRTIVAARRFLVVMLLAMLAAGVSAGAAGKRYVSREYGFATEFPATWVAEPQKTATGTALVVSGPQGTDEYYTTINLQVVVRQPADSLEARANGLERQWATAPAYRRLARTTGTLAGQPAIRLLVEYQQPGGTEKFRQEQVIAERGQYFYLVGYTAPIDLYDKAYGAMKVVLSTFEFLK